MPVYPTPRQSDPNYLKKEPGFYPDRLESGTVNLPGVAGLSAGADFIKTSTGKTERSATLEAAYVMCQAIKAWKEKTGEKVCYKPAGGVSTTSEAVQHYTLVKEILGEDWLNNESFRFGASRLANNLLTSIIGNEVKYF